jgi:hypothetical protein
MGKKKGAFEMTWKRAGSRVQGGHLKKFYIDPVSGKVRMPNLCIRQNINFEFC